MPALFGVGGVLASALVISACDPVPASLVAGEARPVRLEPTAVTPLSRFTVVVDPGHNGRNWAFPKETGAPVDAGGFSKACNTTGTAGAGGGTESALNWAVAGRVATRLRAQGVAVVLTRPDDQGWGPCIDRRGLTAVAAQADLLVSVHHDGAEPGGHGFHVIAPGALVGYTDRTAAPSKVFARRVRDRLASAGFTPSNYVGSDGLVQRTDLGTLNRSGVVAVLVELGNLRNAADLATLSGGDGQLRAADALASAVIDQLTAGSG